jgi:hypothetical protein
MNNIVNSFTFTGKYRFKTYEPSNRTVQELPLSERKMSSISDWHKNLVVYSNTSGLGLITRQLVGDTTYSLPVTQAKIGIGTTAPTAADTNLETSVLAGIIKSTQSFTPTTATLEFFIPHSDLPNGDYTEFGLFCGNQLFARSLISPAFTKSTSEDVGIEYIITLTNS